MYGVVVAALVWSIVYIWLLTTTTPSAFAIPSYLGVAGHWWLIASVLLYCAVDVTPYNTIYLFWMYVPTAALSLAGQSMVWYAIGYDDTPPMQQIYWVILVMQATVFSCIAFAIFAMSCIGWCHKLGRPNMPCCEICMILISRDQPVSITDVEIDDGDPYLESQFLPVSSQ